MRIFCVTFSRFDSTRSHFFRILYSSNTGFPKLRVEKYFRVGNVFKNGFFLLKKIPSAAKRYREKRFLRSRSATINANDETLAPA